MNFVQQLEECLRDLAAEARKKHPGVKEASERATLKLRSLQNRYIHAIRQANKVQQERTGRDAQAAAAASSSAASSAAAAAAAASEEGKEREAESGDGDNDESSAASGGGRKRRVTGKKAGGVSSNSSRPAEYPTTRIFQSSELLHPFLLAANYPNASDRLLEVSFRAMRLLMEGDAVVPSDGIHMVRVWMIQAQVVVSGYYALHPHQPAASSALQSMLGKQKSGRKLGRSEDDQQQAAATEADHGSDDDGDVDDDAPPATSLSATSSWFGWGSSSNVGYHHSTSGDSNPHHHQPGIGKEGGTGGGGVSAKASAAAAVVKNAVMSSSGHQKPPSSLASPAQMEQRAKEILSCLLQLLDTLQKYDEDGGGNGEGDHLHHHHQQQQQQPITKEFWTNAIALGCLWLPAVPVHQTVHQAARSTVLQLLNALYAAAPRHGDLVSATWDDMLTLATLREQEPTSKRLQSLKGAFGLCKKTSRSSSSAAGLSFPPTAGFALELMTKIGKERGLSNGNNKEKVGGFLLERDAKLLQRTKSVTLQLLQEIPKSHTSVEKTLRTLQWTLVFLPSICGGPNHSSSGSAAAEEYTELICQFIKPISQATEACRTQHEFEDGYVYQKSVSSSSVTAAAANSGGSLAPNEPLACLFPPALLWKAGLALEATHHVLERQTQTVPETDSSNHLLATLSECLSDFATIGASCRDHMLQLVEYAALLRDETSHQDGSTSSSSGGSMGKSFSFMRRAEQAVTSGNQALFQKAMSATMATTLPSTTSSPHDGKSSATSNAAAVSGKQKGTTLLLGEALWIALQGVLRIADCMNSMKRHKDSEAAALQILEETFAPSLAVLQHYLKRFVGSQDLVQLSLQGYYSLANVCMSGTTVAGQNTPPSLQRKAILTSLCKLSLPMWGKHDASCLLQDHHVRCLLCLFRIVHTHYNAVSQEWDILLWTLEELSVLAIASPIFSDESYHAALALAASLERFPAFSTCFSKHSLSRLVEALTEIATAAMVDRDVVGESDTVVSTQKGRTTGNATAATSALAVSGEATSSEKNSGDSKETISEKIMSIGVRAIYGNASGAEGGRVGDVVSTMERTKNTFYEDYRRDFVKRLTSTKTAVRVTAIGKLPLSLALLVDVIMANSYRWQECGDEFSSFLSTLAASSPAVRPFAMDVISLLTMSNVSKDRVLPAPFIGPGRLVFADPMQSQLWAVEPDPMEKKDSNKEEEEEEASSTSNVGDKSQNRLLAPTCHTLRTTEKAELAESALGALSSILEGVGHQLCGGDVWCTVIDAVGSLSGDPSYEIDRSSSEWSSCCLMAFRCLKFIVDDFLDQLSSPTELAAAKTRTSLLDCCSSFGRSRHDVNTSLTAIGLLWTIADQDTGSDSIDRALSKLVLLASDSRPEVRNAAVNTLFSCIVGRGGSFSAERWELCFSESIFGVYDLVVAKATAEEKERSSEGGHSEKYKMSLHHSRDSSSKQWVTTQVLVLRGLLRVLRNYFSYLLDTTDTGELEDIPWFQDAWVRILDFAFEAASLNGGRESLDIRVIGVEMLVVCCQLTSEAGIQAVAAPARVGTNMEVVNGALRSVRESQGTKPSYVRSHSRATELSRQSLFLEAFEGLESYNEFVEKSLRDNESIVDDTLLQILHKLSTGMTQLYDCCRGNELDFKNTDQDIRSLQNPKRSADGRAEGDEDLEFRFARMVRTIVTASTVDTKSRFLNQGQRCSLNLLRVMASDGSMEAFKHLVSLAGSSFFVKGEADSDETDSDCDEDDSPDIDLISSEASTAVSEEVAKESTRSACKAMILYTVLGTFSKEYEDHHHRKRYRRYYKRIVPIITNGLKALAHLGESEFAEKATGLVWANLELALSEMLTPTPAWNDMVKISRVGEIIEVLGATRDHVPPGYRSEVSTIFSLGATKSLEIAKQHDAFANSHADSEIGKKSKLHRDDLLKLFSLCFSACCSLDTEEGLLRSTAEQVFKDALLEGNGTPQQEKGGLRFADEVAVMVCRIITQSKKMEPLVISMFSLLCKLVASDKAVVREAAGEVLTVVDVPELLQTAQTRYKEAERRAEKAEKRVGELSVTVDILHQKNQALRREVAVLEASSALPS